jgi:hypothetical protein
MYNPQMVFCRNLEKISFNRQLYYSLNDFYKNHNYYRLLDYYSLECCLTFLIDHYIAITSTNRWEARIGVVKISQNSKFLSLSWTQDEDFGKVPDVKSFSKI